MVGSDQGVADVSGCDEPVSLQPDLCKACGICVSLCPATVFDVTAGGQAVVARPEDCTLCRFCEWHCPDFAIEVLDLRAGDHGETA